METEIYYIRLVRKTTQEYESESSQGGKDQNIFYSTDYFDLMKVSQKKLSEELPSIIGIWPDEANGVDDVAVQSFSLYCSGKMLDTQKSLERNGNPFETKEKSTPYLSVIQVHITPEILAHGGKDLSADSLLELFFGDLCEIVKGYAKGNAGKQFVYRIYKLVSTGDFAVVIRSQEAETSFEISTLIRRRTALAEEADNALVLYKTYTLLTLENNIISWGSDPKAPVLGNNQYVLRCSFSNLYWQQKAKIDDCWKVKNLSKKEKIYSLNGRYDFAVYLTEGDFLALFKYIKEYKSNSSKTGDGDSEIQEFDKSTIEQEYTAVEYIKYLIKNKYISYINERYLLTIDENSMDSPFVAPKIVQEKDWEAKRENFLDYKVFCKYQAIKNKYGKIKEKIAKIKAYRKNIGHYIELLGKLITLCQGINGLSDTRLYAVALLDQLDTILDSIFIYVQIMEESKNKKQILDLLEDYIREAVYALDSYAQYIRNNNLQSLQTPNYNIESDASVEKILIGYSQYLRIFIQFYQDTYRDAYTEGETMRQYLPIVIPDLEARDISVEVLFQGGAQEGWTEENKLRMEYRENNQKERYCMVIRIPTLVEVGNIITVFPTLFHEIAHQLRYEPRPKRNAVLLEYGTLAAMGVLTRGVVRKCCDEIGCYNLTRRIENRLAPYFSEAYLEANYKKDGKYNFSFLDAPLWNFHRCLKDDMKENLCYWGRREDLKRLLKEFIREISLFFDSESVVYREGIRSLNDSFKKIWGGAENQDILEEVFKVVKCAYGMAYEAAHRNYSASAPDLWEEGKFLTWLNEDDGVTMDFKKEWLNAFPDNESIQKVWTSFFRFSSLMYSEFSYEEAIKRYESGKRDQFFEIAYEKLCEAWENDESLKSERTFLNDPNLNWDAMGRLLGIDIRNDRNKNLFKKFLENEIEKYRADMIEKMKYCIDEYREETADIFMCKAMGLTPFGYLYIIAANWRNDLQLPPTHFRRILNVMICQWGMEEGEMKYNVLRENIVLVLQELQKSLLVILKDADRNSDGLEELYQEIHQMRIHWKTDDEDDTIRIRHVILKMQQCCEKAFFLHDINKQKRDSAKYFEMMCRTLCPICGQMENQFGYLEDYAVLLDDYKYGVKVLENMTEKMAQTQNEVRLLGEFCKEVSCLINEPHRYLREPEQYADLNRKSIEFLLEMYYQNKVEQARMMGE